MEEVGLRILECDPAPCLYHFAKSSAAHLQQPHDAQIVKKQINYRLGH